MHHTILQTIQHEKDFFSAGCVYMHTGAGTKQNYEYDS